MQRVLVIGVSGSGKTTLARRIAAACGLRHTEIDALFHGPGWTPRPEFLDDVRELAAGGRWVTEWQYSSQGTDEILPQRADTLVWLDYPRRIVRRRLVWRTFWRGSLRTELWNGNRERPIWQVLRSADPDENILEWQRRTMTTWQDRMPRILAAHPHLTLVRLTHPRRARRWLRTLAPQG